MNRIRFARLYSCFAAVMLLSACSIIPQVPEPSTIEAVSSLPAVVPFTATAEALPAQPSQSIAPTAIAIATPRGPNLEATDPANVQLASGGLQLVEFFRFT